MRNMAPHGGGQLRADPDLRISQVADGKAMGTYWAKIEEQNSDETTQFTSRIEATPDGLPRMAFKTTNGRIWKAILCRTEISSCPDQRGFRPC